MRDSSQSLGRGVVKAVLAAFAVSAVLASVIFIYWQRFPFAISKFDDAYMFLRYADNFLGGYGIRWNRGGPQTYGVSSLLYLSQIVVFLKVLSLPGPQVLVFASEFNALAALVLMAETIRRNAKSSWLQKRYLLFPVVILPLLGAPSFRYHMATGMDTSLAILVHAALIYSSLELLKKPGILQAALAGFFSYLAVLCRVDNLVYAALFPALLIAWLVPQDRRRLLTVWGLCFGILLCFDAGVKRAVFGDVLPLPFYTKLQGFYPNFYGSLMLSPYLLIERYLQAMVPFFVLGGMALRRENIRFAAVFLIPQIVTAAALFQGVQIMGGNSRFYFPGLPFTVVGALLLVDDLLSRQTSRAEMEKIGIRFITACLIIVMAPAGIHRIAERLSQWRYSRIIGQFDFRYYHFMEKNPPAKLSWWQGIEAVDAILRAMPEGSSFAASEHGYLSSRYPGVMMIDMTGLHDAFIAKHGFSAAYILSHSPDLIWFPHSDYTDAVNQFWSIPDFWRDYEYYPRAFKFGMAIRKTSRHYALIREAFSQVWQRTYPGIAMEEEKVAEPVRMKALVSAESAAYG